MKLVFLMIMIFGCSHSISRDPFTDLKLLQAIWDSKDIDLAFKRLPGLKVMEEDLEYQVFGTKDHPYLLSFAISVSKKTRQIVSMRAPLIKSELHPEDWKTYEHPIKGTDYIQLDVTEYSENLGVGFAYDKLDKDKKTRMIYWGVDPKKIQQIL